MTKFYSGVLIAEFICFSESKPTSISHKRMATTYHNRSYSNYNQSRPTFHRIFPIRNSVHQCPRRWTGRFVPSRPIYKVPCYWPRRWYTNRSMLHSCHLNIHIYRERDTYIHTCLLLLLLLSQASDFRIERRQVVFLCWMQDSKLGSPRHQIVSRLKAHSQTDWAIEDLCWVSIQTLNFIHMYIYRTQFIYRILMEYLHLAFYLYLCWFTFIKNTTSNSPFPLFRCHYHWLRHRPYWRFNCLPWLIHKKDMGW